MRTVLVCVRSPVAAQQIASAAGRLGLSSVVQTAVSAPEAMLRLAERPADVVLADTALTRPDSAGFVRRALIRAPRAAILLLGAEEATAAAATITAGARGLIQGADHDLTSAVAKALLLLAAESGRRVAAVVAGGELARPAGTAGSPATARPLGAAETTETGCRSGDSGVPPVVPVQRGDDEPDGSDGDEATRAPSSRNGTAPARSAPATAARPGPAARDAMRRGSDVTLTERELQVLLGMAEGKSNAEIGRELFVSEDTVKTHARRLFRKLGARDRAHAVAAGFRAGLVA